MLWPKCGEDTKAKVVASLGGYSGLYGNLLKGHRKEDHDQDWKSLKNTLTAFALGIRL